MQYVQDYAEVFASRLNADSISLYGQARRRDNRKVISADGIPAGEELTADPRARDLKRIAGSLLSCNALLSISAIVAGAINLRGWRKIQGS